MTRPLIGILGGTFDPVHLGHMQLATDAIETLSLDQLRCVPAGRPPHRRPPVASAADRLRMAQLAFGDLPRCEIDAAEILKEAPSWTIDTLKRLRAELSEAALVLILGADAFLGLPTWHRWQEINELAHLAVANRPGSALDTSSMPRELAALWRRCYIEDLRQLRDKPAGYLVSFTMTPCLISATQVRQTVNRGESISALVYAPVATYIHQHHLYSHAR